EGSSVVLIRDVVHVGGVVGAYGRPLRARLVRNRVGPVDAASAVARRTGRDVGVARRGGARDGQRRQAARRPAGRVGARRAEPGAAGAAASGGAGDAGGQADPGRVGSDPAWSATACRGRTRGRRDTTGGPRRAHGRRVGGSWGRRPRRVVGGGGRWWRRTRCRAAQRRGGVARGVRGRP